MRPEIYWVRGIEPLRFGLMARPRSGDWLEEEVLGWRAAGIGTVVSLLEAAETYELGLDDEASLCAANGIELISMPVPDRGTPERPAEFLRVAESVAASVAAGRPAAVHCRAGIGRSGLFGACVLKALGTPAAEAFSVLSRARGVDVPDTPAQVAWFNVHCRERTSPSN